MPLSDDILGLGWKFPFQFDHRGGIAKSAGVQHVVESIAQILGTPIGERFFRRDFGSRLQSHVFYPADTTIDVEVEDDVRTAIERWEPRVNVLGIRVDHTLEKEGRVDIEIDFEVIQTQERGNMVYPFYLPQGAS